MTSTELLKDKDRLDKLKDLVIDAGHAILEIYRSNDFDVQLKGNDSPVTKADLAAHHVLVNGLSALTPSIPIVSEEDENSLSIPQESKLYWLIDPLDGTKEFIQKSDEFTVNLALIDNNRPVFGIVGIPALDILYWGGDSYGAFKLHNAITQEIHVEKSTKKLRVFASKSHLNEETQNFIDNLSGEIELVQAGSSLKFLRIAEGEADIYPRLGPTCEWDTAAAHAVLEGAGGSVTQVNGSNLIYGKTDILNPFFIAKGLM